MDLCVRDVRLDDAEAIIGILNPIIAARRFSALDTPLTIEQEREFIRTFSERGIFLVAERSSDSKLVGCQDVEPFATYTHAFDHVGVIGTFVDEAFRHQGVAKRLFDATFARARQKGYEKFFTYVRADNLIALEAYLAQGFSIVGTATRQAKIDGRYIDEMVIEKLL
jgi:L-amino acid N-acyltransferase YncA